jgi:hypothetical protein
MTDPIVTAAAPELIAVIKALQAFNAAMGPDPTKWVVNYPGAKLIETGTILQQLPALASAEGGVAINALDSLYAGWIAKLGGPAA